MKIDHRIWSNLGSYTYSVLLGPEWGWVDCGLPNEEWGIVENNCKPFPFLASFSVEERVSKTEAIISVGNYDDPHYSYTTRVSGTEEEINFLVKLSSEFKKANKLAKNIW